jgi:DNA-binding CsgD family transcriptional regulator
MGVDLVVDRNRGGSGLVHAVCDRQVRALPRVPLRPVRPGEPRLSDRELEVIRLLAGGWTTLDVARAMSISPKTVENHKQRIFVKLDARNAAHAVARAVRLGLVSEPHEYAAVGS